MPTNSMSAVKSDVADVVDVAGVADVVDDAGVADVADVVDVYAGEIQRWLCDGRWR